MAESSPVLSIQAKLKKWEQKALHQDCVLTRNRHQLMIDEKLAKELQSKLDVELAHEITSSDNPEVPTMAPERRHREINLPLRRVARRPSRPTRDQPLQNYGAARRQDLPPQDQSLQDYEALHELAEILGPAKKPGMRPSEIDLLPKRRFLPQDVPKESSATNTCHICLNNWKRGDSIKSLPCFHDFHAKCISDWLKIKNSCPVCRLEVKLSDR